VLELNGVLCMDLELIAPDKQQIISSRAFSQMITDYDSMQQAVAHYVARAAEKLRQQNGVCRQVSVGITPIRSNKTRRNITTWPMKRYKHSPRYTTQWGELPVVYINKGQPHPSP
jgi:nucleotidyltransferase/DNA polymerase involved in DNA repair